MRGEPGLPHAELDDQDYTYVMSMTKDDGGDLWMATYGAGVWRYDGKVLTHYPVMVNGNPITVFSIYCDREGGLWLGTHEHGVRKFNGRAFEKVKFGCASARNSEFAPQFSASLGAVPRLP